MKSILLAVLTLSSLALANEGGFGQLSVSCQGVTTTGACTTFNVHPPDFVHIPQANSFTWQTIFSGGTPTSGTFLLEGSIDGTTWSTIDTSTSTAGETRSKSGTAYSYFRCNVAAYVRNGTTLTCQITPAQTQGSVGASSFSDLSGAATDAQIPNNITIDHAATADTATALAANGANCSAGQAPLGVNASGAAEGCFTPGAGSYLVLSAQVGNTDAVNCPANTTANFATTYTIPANYLVANKLLRLTMAFNVVATATVPTMGFRLSIGGTSVYAGTPVASSVTTGQPLSISFLIQGSAAASGSAAVYTHATEPAGAAASGAFSPWSGGASAVVQPVNLATNGTLAIQPIFFCSAATAGNSMTLQQMIVEALN